MHTVELLEHAIATAHRLGYTVRHEWLGGSGGGFCEFGGRRWVFVDLALNSLEQLQQVADVLQQDPGTYLLELPDPLRRLLGIRKTA